ncbi:MAG TPA: sulfatase-like hydrolase/transferase [Chitinophagales bacterium]|nr:sulfatase-like hydrolase/transferase [Chitinophagales bacterium]
MWKDQFFHLKILFKRLGILLIVYMICRILFFTFNRDLFPELSVVEFLLVMLNGLRYDIASIIYINGILIIMHILPIAARETSLYQRIIKILFYVCNGLALFLEAGDFIYFRYGLKRTSTHELGLANDTSVLPMVMKDYWVVFVLTFIIILLVEWLYRKTEFTGRNKSRSPLQIHYPAQIILMTLVIIFSVVGARGGLQQEIISPNDAGIELGDNRFSELIINTPFSVIYAIGHRHLEVKDYFKPEHLNNYYNIHHQKNQFYKWPDSIPKQKDNVCVIVLESFSKEYLGYFYPQQHFTPFLDSLMNEGLCFTNAYSNGKSSNQGIIAVNSSIPVMMEDPFISSVYQQNNFVGVGSLVKKMGYGSYFFHGANNGTMGFDKFLARAGFDGYFGRNEYGNDKDFDGNWGIFDEPFLQWTANKMSTLPTPFYSEIFTISSHHPFTIPPQYIGRFPKGQIPMMATVAYTDYALQQFFEEAKKQPWYNNTLFILTADHPGPPNPGSFFYQNQIGAHATWLLLYKPNGQFKGKSDMVVQQSDIMPTVLDYIGYTGKYTAFGNSVFDTLAPHFAFNFHAGEYMLLDSNFMLQYNGNTVLGLYDYKNDSILIKNVSADYPDVTLNMEDRLKAIIQLHNDAMIYNKLAE